MPEWNTMLLPPQQTCAWPFFEIDIRDNIYVPEKDIFKIFIFWWKGTKMTSFQFHLNMSVNKIFVLAWFYFCHYNKKSGKEQPMFSSKHAKQVLQKSMYKF